MTRKVRAPRTARRRDPPAGDARTRILDAALVELAARGFEAASTNAIARAARVAKGLVFHHFGSKEALYFAVIERVIDRVADQIFAIDPMPDDLFERLHAIAVQKLRVFQRDPLAYQLLMATVDAPPAIQTRLEERKIAHRFVGWQRFLDGLDASRLRRGVTLDHAIETLTILGLGIERTYLTRLARLPDRGRSQIEQLTQELWTHFERLRDGVYR